MLAATNGSLAPSGIGHPFWKMSTDIWDPVPERKRTTLILSCMTIVKDNYEFKGEVMSQIDFHVLKCDFLT